MDWNDLKEFLNGIEQHWGIPACECAVTIAHERVFHHASGYADVLRTRPAEEGDLYWIYSLSKLFTCTAALQLIERGRMKLDDPVAQFLPSWTHISVKSGSGTIPCGTPPTILQLMTMTCGLTYNLDAPAIVRLRKETGDRFSLKQFADGLAQEPLDFFPGEHYQYSLCYDVLGAVIEQVSGVLLEDYMRIYIKEPLGAEDLTFFPTEGQFARFSTEYRYHEQTNGFEDVKLFNPFALSSAYASGGAGLCSSVCDGSLLVDALANGGMAATGQRILSENSVRRMASDCLSPKQKSDFVLMKPAPYSYGLGVRTLTESAWGVPKGEFGWDGAAGAYALVDPGLQLSLIYAQHVLDHYRSYSELHPALRDTLYRIVRSG